jgi:hypothetical protein
MITWPALLDAIDRGLSSFPPVFVDLERYAAVVGPLPPALAARAATTLRRMAEAEAALEHHRSGLARELAALSSLKATTPQTGASSVPHYLDTKA